MNYVFAPSESRAQDFIRNNSFGIDDRAKIRLPHMSLKGEKYREEDVLYILDGCPDKMLVQIQTNTMKSRSAPQAVSVEER